MAIIPLPTLTLEAMDNVIVVCAPILAALTDYAGNIITPAPVMRSLYNETVIQNPEVIVSVRFGAMPPQSGHNLLWQDDDSGLFMAGMLAKDSRIIFDVVGRNDAERHLLIDVLTAGILSNIAPDPTQHNMLQEEAIIEQLAGQGIVFKGFQETVFDDINLKDARPVNMQFTATLIMLSDIWVTWDVPEWAGFQGFNIGTTMYPDTGYGDSNYPNPTWGPLANPTFRG